MIRVYLLSVQTIANTETVEGVEYIHNAILDCTIFPTVRKLIMDTTDEEHQVLSALALQIRNPTPNEIATFETRITQPPPNPDEVRLQELTATSPVAITMPEIWEAIRILAKLRGIKSTTP